MTLPETSQSAHALALFAFFFGIACLFDHSRFTYWARDPIELACVAAAVCVVCRPRSVQAFLAFCTLYLATNFDNLPDEPNHWLFDLVVCATILVSALVVWARERDAPIDPGRLYQTFAPVVRVELLVLYFFVVFHKLNTDFLSPDISCAATHYKHLTHVLRWLPNEALARGANIWATLAIESAIPLLLISRRTRTFGVLIGLVFHYFLGVNYYFDFSSVLYALYVLFSPDGLGQSVVERWRESKASRLASRIPPWLAAVTIFLAWTIASDNSFDRPERRFGTVWTCYAVLWFAGYLWAIRRNPYPQAPARRVFGPLQPALLIFPLLLFVNGLSPYLGLKTETSFAMFSNLRTEAGRSNHLIVPNGALKIWNYQDDLVTVLHSSDPELEKLAEDERPIPYYTLHDLVSRAAERHAHRVQLVYERGGQRFELRRAELDPTLSRPPSFLARKLLIFRPIQTGPRELCMH